jgi:hypothetical protein
MSTTTIASLVHSAWYSATYPDILTRNQSALEHYQEQGWREGRHPNPYFDPSYYIAQSSEQVRVDPLLHYVLQGEAAGYRPCRHFDPAWYRGAHRLEEQQSPLAHYLTHRFSGDVSPSRNFDARFYLETNPDVRAAGLDPLQHYLSSGRYEFRLPKPERLLIEENGLFDEEFYLFYYEDVRRAGVDPLGHFLANRTESRKPNLYFDTEWYIGRYGLHYPYTPLCHYLLIGEALGHLPSLRPYFNPSWYRQRYDIPDQTPALTHYLAHRKEQAVSPNPGFDVVYYVARADGLLRRGRDPYLHFLSVGSLRGLEAGD